MERKIKVGVVGATGYTGLELVKMLALHPVFELSYIANSEGGIKIDELHPSLRGVCEDEVHKADIEQMASRCELVFLALPHKTAMAYVKPLIALGVKVVDLSADYRLPQSLYEEFYVPHTDAKTSLPWCMVYLSLIAKHSTVLNLSQTLDVFQLQHFWVFCHFKSCVLPILQSL